MQKIFSHAGYGISVGQNLALGYGSWDSAIHEKYFPMQDMESPWDRTWPGIMAPGMPPSRGGSMKWNTLSLEADQKRMERQLDIILRYLFLKIKLKYDLFQNWR